MAELISLDSVIETLRSSIPDAEWFLRHIESEQGIFKFPPYLADTITNLKIESYPRLYTNENAIGAMLFRAFMSDEELKELNAELEAASPDERGEFITEFSSSFCEGIERIEIPKTPAEQEAARQRFLSLPEAEQKEAIRIGQHFFCAFFASFFQNLSVMVHGEKLTALVAQAVAGNDEAFAKAVQIDRRILTECPYFKERFVRAQFDRDEDFNDLISYRVQHSPYRGKIRHKTLWLTFSFLELTGHLNELKHREILEICDEVGVGGWDNRIQEVKHLTRRLDEYRKFQNRGRMNTP
jgi:hypothetical protein